MFELKEYRGVMFDGTEDLSVNLKEKMACAFKNDMMNFANFYQRTRKYKNWVFDEMLLSKV